MVLGPVRLCTINFSVENSAYLKHLSPAKGKKHQSIPLVLPPRSETRGSDVHGESLVLWLQLSPGERSTEKFKGAEKLMQLENQAKPEQV